MVKTKFSKFILIGLACLGIFLFSGFFLVKKSSIPFYLIYVLCMLVWIVLTLTAMSLTMSDKRCRSWLLLIPFTVSMMVMRLCFNWNVIIPFLIVGLLAVFVDSAREISEREEMPMKPVLKHFAATVGSIIVYICIYAFMGVTV